MQTSEIFPKLLPHQRAMLVPGLVGCSVNSSYGRSVSKQLQEQALLQKLEGYYAWAQTDARIAGINSWHFNHCESLTFTPALQFGPDFGRTFRKPCLLPARFLVTTEV